MNLWCTPCRANHTLTGNDVELIVYYLDWRQANMLVNPQFAAAAHIGTAPDDEDADHMICLEQVLVRNMTGELAGDAIAHVNDCHTRRLHGEGRVPR